MSNVAKLKKQAADFEAKKQLDKALGKYVELIQSMESSDEDVDVALYNRVGDLFARQNNIGEAVNYYEKAVDAYSETGLFNNAIALCNKILRVSPGRTSIILKLGRISAHKGFKADARQNFLEYASRMQKAGQMDEAFRALKEFADLCPDEDEVRLMLADQLVKHNRKTEALEQLETLYHTLDAGGRADEAQAAVERIQALDPNYEIKERTEGQKRKTTGLVFLEVDEPKRPTGRRSAVEDKRASRALDSLPLIDVGEPEPGRAPPAKPKKKDEKRPAPPPSAAAPPEPVGDAAGIDTDVTLETPAGGIDGLDTGFGFGTDTGDAAGLIPGLESTSLDPAADDSSVLDTDRIGADLTIEEGAGASAEMDAAFEESPTPRRSSVEMLRDMVPPMLREEESTEVPALDVSGLEITPGIDDSGMADFGASLNVGDLGISHDTDADLLHVDVTLDVPEGLDDERGVDAAALMFGEDIEAPARGSGRASRQTGTTLAMSVDGLRERVEAEPENWEMHRLLGESLLEAGDREGALHHLETAMIGYEKADELGSASSVVDAIVHLEPDSIRFLQKRVEYAFRTNDRPRLVEAYLGLADGLVQAGQGDKSRAVYQRVLDLSPDDLRAQAALEALGPETPGEAPEPKEKSGIGRRYTAEVRRGSKAAPPPAPARAAAPRPDDEFVNLGDWLRDDEGPKDTRMKVEEQEPTGDEEADFADMLRKFKQGVAENVEEEDHESHYDLGVAYKEMGLLDEAISEFQKALRGTENRVRTYEALGHCFMEKGQYQVALTVLSRALSEPDMTDDQLVGVLYLLGWSSEALQKYPEALEFYQRVFSVDIQFRDVGERIMAVEQVAR